MFLNGFSLVLWCNVFVLIALSDEPRQNQGRGLNDRKLVKAPHAPQQFYCSLVILDVVCRYLSLFLLYISIKIVKKMLSVGLAGDNLYVK